MLTDKERMDWLESMFVEVRLAKAVLVMAKNSLQASGEGNFT